MSTFRVQVDRGQTKVRMSQCAPRFQEFVKRLQAMLPQQYMVLVGGSCANGTCEVKVSVFNTHPSRFLRMKTPDAEPEFSVVFSMNANFQMQQPGAVRLVKNAPDLSPLMKSTWELAGACRFAMTL